MDSCFSKYVQIRVSVCKYISKFINIVEFDKEYTQAAEMTFMSKQDDALWQIQQGLA